MPKQTPARSSKKSGPYPSPKRRRALSSQTKVGIAVSPSVPEPAPEPEPVRPAAMNTSRMATGASATMAPQAANPWQRTATPVYSMPPPLSYTQRLSMPERLPIHPPPSPGTPGHLPSTSTPWSAQDDEILLAARAQAHGWNQIQRDNFPTKSSNACRKRYERLIAKRRGSDWNDERVDKVASYYMQLREKTWQPLAEAVGEDWRDVEKLCLERGARTLLPTLGQRDLAQGASEPVSRRGSHDSHDDEKLSIHNLLH
ncbi:hypothetical protein TMEN_8917 [Trichophyton mentagrophytes]|uniref:Myb-like domain-containing protein n=1 Tax=Trichophyton interdigitale (strain MR816) TaxID=1215338 RepID=A0A059JF14_TRIIM|nr:hypothetical protein H101_07168 [Trichophyton interdigitale H6]KAG5205199.1 Myb-like domain-containing protein [Trichophyton interdigitale]KDB26384.1 hypothetical protein H109_01808 [Trichophyton interdigitale MR816]GBF64566.1 hypothetical protein TMEN_7282 [Trichophyton mentagrophytes]KAG5218556.1 Myb-like domain-containing protein [Trichophyton interdigitale]